MAKETIFHIAIPVTKAPCGDLSFIKVSQTLLKVVYCGKAQYAWSGSMLPVMAENQHQSSPCCAESVTAPQYDFNAAPLNYCGYLPLNDVRFTNVGFKTSNKKSVFENFVQKTSKQGCVILPNFDVNAQFIRTEIPSTSIIIQYFSHVTNSFPARPAHVCLHYHSLCLPQHDYIIPSSAQNACCVFYEWL